MGTDAHLAYPPFGSRSFVEHPARPEDADLLVVLSPAPAYACRTCVAPQSSGDPEIGYLIPSLASMGSSGGAISHIRGFLYGLKGTGRTCRVFSGTPLAQDAFENEIVDPARRPYFFWEAAMLSYNFGFARGVQRDLASTTPAAFYQRHCRFSIAGALLSTRLKVPLILEYNGPEGWIADHWDPTLSAADQVVRRIDAALRHQDHCGFRGPARGTGRQRYPGRSHSGQSERCGSGLFLSWTRERSRTEEATCGARRGAGRLCRIVQPVAWNRDTRAGHRQAVERPLHQPLALCSDGQWPAPWRNAFRPGSLREDGKVIFTGSLPSEKVVEYLDASDILVSPHIPMPDGSRFFGSPTKLFEYMAMGKGIVASRLEQLAEVLEHDRTAWLVTPGDVEELAEAIRRLALDPAKREALGHRRAACRGRTPQLGAECRLGLERHADAGTRSPGRHEYRRRNNSGSMTRPSLRSVYVRAMHDRLRPSPASCAGAPAGPDRGSSWRGLRSLRKSSFQLAGPVPPAR